MQLIILCSTNNTKIKRFINIYQSNGPKNANKKNFNGIKIKNVNKIEQSSEHYAKNEEDISLDPIKVYDSTPVDVDIDDEQSHESSLEIVAVSYDQNSQPADCRVETETSSYEKYSKGKQKVTNKKELQNSNTERVHTITPDWPVNTIFPVINMSTSTRNMEKNAASNLKKFNKGIEHGKPPLCIDSQKKSIYPDSLSYKQGTANSKIIQLREHLTKSNTVSYPDLLKEEQAIIDSMFSEKGRQASKERENYPLSIYIGAHQRRKKRGMTKPLHPINERGISSATGQKQQREHSLNTNALKSENSK